MIFWDFTLDDEVIYIDLDSLANLVPEDEVHESHKTVENDEGVSPNRSRRKRRRRVKRAQHAEARSSSQPEASTSSGHAEVCSAASIIPATLSHFQFSFISFVCTHTSRVAV